MRQLDRFEMQKLTRELYELDVIEERIKREMSQLPDIEARRVAINKKIQGQYTPQELEELSA